MEGITIKEKWVLFTENKGAPLLHHFRISNHGNVMKIKKGEGPEEAFYPKEIGGYKYLSLTSKNGSRETAYLHKLIAELFVKPKGVDFKFVIHKDYDRTNNHTDNLEWVTKEVLYSHRSSKAGRIPGKTNSRKKLLRPEGITDESVALKEAEFKSLVAQVLGISP